MDNKRIKVAITHGDTNGIGYELIFSGVYLVAPSGIDPLT